MKFRFAVAFSVLRRNVNVAHSFVLHTTHSSVGNVEVWCFGPTLAATTLYSIDSM
jgi:hypothetical protein